MRVFVTGASGFVGSAVVPELVAAGHQVTGLARSDASAAAIAAHGAEVVRGDLADLEVLRAASAAAEGVIHLAFVHDFSNFAESARLDQQAISTMGAALEESGRPLLIVSGVLGLASGRLGTEHDLGLGPEANPRAAGQQVALALAERGVRTGVVRLAPTVHDANDHGFVSVLVDVARRSGVSGYVGDGTNRWPAVHRGDAARLFRLALEDAPAGSLLHGIAEEGVPTREIAQAIGDELGLPTVAVAPDQAAEHFGWLGAFFAADVPTSNAITRELLGWEPTGPTLLDDLKAGVYTR